MYKVYSVRLTADFSLETMGSRKQWDEIKDDLNEWEDILCSWIGRPNIVKVSILTKVICRFSATSVRISKSQCFYRKRKNNSKIHMEPQKTQNKPKQT